MKKFFFAHPDVILATIAIVLLVALIGVFSWGINDVVFEVEHASVVVAGQAPSGFNLKDAQSLDFRGISTSTSVSTGGTTVSSSTSATSTTSVASSTSPSSLLRP